MTGAMTVHSTGAAGSGEEMQVLEEVLSHEVLMASICGPIVFIFISID